MKIFISYSTQDKEIVRGLEKYISKEMVNTWIDHKAIGGGSSLTKTITKGISNADIYFLFISHNSLDSDWVKKEIKLAMKKEEKLKYEFIVPVVLEEEAWDNWNEKKLKDRKYISYDEDIHTMAHEIKDTIVNKTIEKFEHECLLKGKVVENILGVIAVILFSIAFFTEPTEKEHIFHLQNESNYCSASQVNYEDVMFLSYATCPISQDKKLFSVGIFNMIFSKEIENK